MDLPRLFFFVSSFFKNGPSPAFFAFILSFQTIQFFKQKYVNNVHPVYGTGIRTHDFQNMYLLLWPLDQGS